jgi:DNA-binding NarL/FixJ family response regulator
MTVPTIIRVLLVDDQVLFRQGLASLLGLETDLEVVGQAGDGQAAILLANQFQPDVILMDIRMPVCDGIQATQQIHQTHPQIRILVLTTFDEDDLIWDSLRAGAAGYLLKNTPSEQVAAAIRTVHQGHSQLGPTIAARLFAQLPANRLPEQVKSLSQRELDILKLLANGKSNREIAQHLFLTEGTVKNYITRILQQLQLRDRTQAALWAKQNL